MIIFHGGCHGCTQQDLNGVEFCKGCQYFDAEWEKPNLSNEPPRRADVVREQIRSGVYSEDSEDSEDSNSPEIPEIPDTPDTLEIPERQPRQRTRRMVEYLDL